MRPATTQPKSTTSFIARRRTFGETEDYGVLFLTLMECDKVASADLKGHHFVHFIATTARFSRKHRRQARFEIFWRRRRPGVPRHFDRRISGQDQNQERTAFMFEDIVLDRIINDVCTSHIEVSERTARKARR
ncbi:MAG: hypothetical protein IPN84_17635 [Sphingomonadales bacterium]|nr:hypothetical protein [Sphingomonadales bacterium]